MSTLSRWLAPLVLAAGFGAAALAPTPARAQSDDLARVIVDVADVIFRSGTPYYRQGNYGHDDRLIVLRDRYGRPVYYREVPRHLQYRPVSHRDYRPPARQVKCNKHGKCKVTSRYYDPRYDRRHDDRFDHRYDDRYYSYDRRDRDDDDRRWDRRDRDDD